ncbi:MAG: O-acetyl-ADP-ribose deacetylase [Anaerolineae bacterium]
MGKIELWQGDITTLAVDAIVNAANNALRGGGGVDGAIHRAAGPALDEACRAIGWCPTGQAVITPGFKLPARYIIHTVGPVWGAQAEVESDALLASCYRASLELAVKRSCQSVAFPAISTGVYGYPAERAARIAVGTVQNALEQLPGITRVVLVSFSGEMHRLYQRILGQAAPGGSA